MLIGIEVVAEGRPAGVDGVGEDASDGAGEPADVRSGEAVGACERVDPGVVEGLVGVDVADAGEKGLVEQSGFDGPCGAGQGWGEAFAVDVERVGAEPGPAPFEVGRVGQCPEAAEASWVAEGESGAVVEPPEDVEVVGLTEPSAAWSDEELSGHAEVNEQRASGGADEGELLAASSDVGDPVAGEELCFGDSSWPGVVGEAVGVAREAAGGVVGGGDDVAAADRDGGRRPADERALQEPTHVLDLGQLGHRRSV